jgi:hypothetical protein
MGNQMVFKKTGGFLENQTVFFFQDFFNIFQFAEFSRTRYFKFLNSVLTKHLEIDSSFFKIYYLKKFNF